MSFNRRTPANFDRLDFNPPRVTDRDPPFFADLVFSQETEELLPLLGFVLASELINNATSRNANPVRVLVYNKYVENDFDNPNFVNLFTFASQMLAVNEEEFARSNQRGSIDDVVANTAIGSLAMFCGLEYVNDPELQNYCDFDDNVHNDLLEAADMYDQVSRQMSRTFGRGNAGGARSYSNNDRGFGRGNTGGRSYQQSSRPQSSGRQYGSINNQNVASTGLVRNTSGTQPRAAQPQSNSARRYVSNGANTMDQNNQQPRSYARQSSPGHRALHEQRTSTQVDTGDHHHHSHHHHEYEELDNNDQPTGQSVRRGVRNPAPVAKQEDEVTYLRYEDNKDKFIPGPGTMYVPLYDEINNDLFIVIEPGQPNRFAIRPKQENIEEVLLDIDAHTKALGLDSEDVLNIGRVLESDPQSYEGLERDRRQMLLDQEEIRQYRERNEEVPAQLKESMESYKTLTDEELGLVNCATDGADSIFTSTEQAMQEQTVRVMKIESTNKGRPIIAYGKYNITKTTRVVPGVRELMKYLADAKDFAAAREVLNLAKLSVEKTNNVKLAGWVQTFNRELTELTNSIYSLRLGIDVQIDNFMKDYGDLEGYITSKFGREVYGAALNFEPMLLKATFTQTDPQLTDILIDSVVSTKDNQGDDIVPEPLNIDPRTVIAQNRVVVIVDLQATHAQLGYTQLDHQYRLLTSANSVGTQVLNSLAENHLPKTPASTLIIRTADDVKIELSNGPNDTHFVRVWSS